MTKQPEDFDLHLIEAFNEIMRLTLHCHTDPVNAFQDLKDPTEGWRGCRVINLVRHGLLVRGQWRSESALCHEVDSQREGHHHEQPFNPAGFFDKERGDNKQRVFEKPQAPFDVSLIMPLYD